MASRTRDVIPPKAILFDIGRVIVRLDLQRAFAPIASAWKQQSESAPAAGGVTPTAEQIWEAIQRDPKWRDWQEGRMSPEQWHEHITRRLHIELSFDEFCKAWNRALDLRTILTDQLFEKLGNRYRLGLLSNTDPIHVACMEREFTFLRHFPVRIYSCAVGLSKPSPAIYQHAVRAMDAAPDETIYIDDVDEFVEAARGQGLDAILFENPVQLASDLQLRGVSAE